MYTVIVSPSVRLSMRYIQETLKDDPFDPKYIFIYDYKGLDRARYCQLKEAHYIYRSWEVPLLDRITDYLKQVKCPIKYSE